PVPDDSLGPERADMEALNRRISDLVLGEALVKLYDVDVRVSRDLTRPELPVVNVLRAGCAGRQSSGARQERSASDSPGHPRHIHTGSVRFVGVIHPLTSFVRIRASVELFWRAALFPAKYRRPDNSCQ